jgi:hypothetical protein
MAGIHRQNNCKKAKDFVEDLVFSKNREKIEEHISRKSTEVYSVPSGLQRFLRRQNKTAKMMIDNI